MALHVGHQFGRHRKDDTRRAGNLSGSYGGKIEWHQTTYSARYDDLANAINSDEGIDFFYAGDWDAFPKGAVRGMFVPYDDYLDLDSELWQM